MGLQKSISRLTLEQTDTLWKWIMRSAFFVVLIALWEWFGRTQGGLLFAPFTDTVVAWIELMSSAEIYEALWISNQAMVIGFFAAIILGIPLGLFIGRLQRYERFIDPYINVLIVTPMAAIIPLIIIAIGLGLLSRVMVVFVFAFPIVVVNTRAGLKNLDPALIEMGRSFGATEMQLWRKVLLPGATPAIMAGVRLGLGRSLSGMVVVELLLVAVGLGKLIVNSMGFFEPEKMYAVIIVIIIEVVVVMEVAKRVEARLISWKPRLQ